MTSDAGGTPKVPRVLILVCDSFGVGGAPDAEAYGDEGSDTLGNTAAAVGGIHAPNLGALGLGMLTRIEGVEPRAEPGSAHGRLTERSAGKDTTTGHWEMTGIVLTEPFPLYPDGFPPEIIEAFEQAIGREVLGNVPASGTEIIARARRGAPAHRQADRLHERRLGVPGRDAHGRGPAADAVRVVPRRPAPVDRHAQRGARDRASVHGGARRVRPPPRATRLLGPAARTDAARPLRRARRRGLRGRQDPGHLRAAGADRGALLGLERSRRRSHDRVPAPPRPGARVQQPRRLRQQVRSSQRPRGLRARDRGARRPDPRADRRARRRGAVPDRRPRVRPDDAAHRSLARTHPAARRGARRWSVRRRRPRHVRRPRRHGRRAARRAVGPARARASRRGSARERPPRRGRRQARRPHAGSRRAPVVRPGVRPRRDPRLPGRGVPDGRVHQRPGRLRDARAHARDGRLGRDAPARAHLAARRSTSTRPAAWPTA